MKRILSANSEAQLAIECLMDDVDVRGTMNREGFEVLAAPVLERVRSPLAQALADAGLAPADIACVEVVGSSTRIPSVARIIEEVFGKPVSRTLNAKECVSRGCALQCAMLSPTFRVRDFEVIDAAPYSVVFTWEKEDGSGTASQLLFERNSAVPKTKLLTFLRAKPFDVTARYADDAALPAGAPRVLGVYHVGPFAPPAGAEKAKIKARPPGFSLSLSCCRRSPLSARLHAAALRSSMPLARCLCCCLLHLLLQPQQPGQRALALSLTLPLPPPRRPPNTRACRT